MQSRLKNAALYSLKGAQICSAPMVILGGSTIGLYYYFQKGLYEIDKLAELCFENGCGFGEYSGAECPYNFTLAAEIDRKAARYGVTAARADLAQHWPFFIAPYMVIGMVWGGIYGFCKSPTNPESTPLLNVEEGLQRYNGLDNESAEYEMNLAEADSNTPEEFKDPIFQGYIMAEPLTIDPCGHSLDQFSYDKLPVNKNNEDCKKCPLCREKIVSVVLDTELKNKIAKHQAEKLITPENLHASKLGFFSNNLITQVHDVGKSLTSHRGPGHN